MWLRAQTIRCTEQFVALNTHNSPIGATTRERLCSMVPKPNISPPEVFAVLNQRKVRNRRHNRLSGTLKFLQSLGAQIKGKVSAGKTDVSEKLAEGLRLTLQRAEVKGRVHIYTDGSTDPRGNACNSGVGIYVTDERHSEIWQGGFHLRTEGNNFIAELAGAATVLNAIPPKCAATLWIDSTSTILAIQKGVRFRTQAHSSTRKIVAQLGTDFGTK